MTHIYFVRHCQSDHSIFDDRIRPLTEEGLKDSCKVLDFFKMHEIPLDIFISSPYKRSYDSILSTAAFYNKIISTDERLRERKYGKNANNNDMFKKCWSDKNFAEKDSESIYSVQKRNIEALSDILKRYEEKNIIIGTHGIALSCILNFYNNHFDYDSFLRIINFTPYIIRCDFNKNTFIEMQEEFYIEKVYSA